MTAQSPRQQFVIIDGNELSFEKGETLLEVAARAEIEIPTLCYDPRLTPAGACRMCLVEVEGARLMQPACSAKATPGMVVRTQTPRVERNRQFILSLHLADTVQERGAAEDAKPSRIFEHVDCYGTAGEWPAMEQARLAREHDDNAFIAYRPEHCILCSLCTRYCDQVEAVSAITLAGRGAETTISTADRQSLTDTTCELCGGCVDVCPTGAMTEKAGLAWGKPERELEKVRSTCNFCGVGCQVDLNVDREANRVVKVTSPPPGTTVNDGNLCVKGRFANDFIHHEERLTTPLVRGDDGQLHPASWDEAFDRVVAGLEGVAERHGADSLAFISSSRCTGEENYLVQKLARAAFRTHNVHQCAAT
ncbi:MAG: 2Fe-2S iron-sulfur cluster-binding protein [Holophagales bacterium]|nr:2Fe-2S iron-sulfur cluster-binding protein [Holophagales bacterium]